MKNCIVEPVYVSADMERKYYRDDRLDENGSMSIFLTDGAIEYTIVRD